MRLALLAALCAHCAAPASPPPSPAAMCPPPSRPSPRPRAFVPRDCDCAALCAPCGGARVRPEADEARAEARGRCPTWHEACACPACDDAPRGERPAATPAR